MFKKVILPIILLLVLFGISQAVTNPSACSDTWYIEIEDVTVAQIMATMRYCEANQTLYGYCDPEHALYQSTDHAETWEKIFDYDIDADPVPSYVYTNLFVDSNGNLYQIVRPTTDNELWKLSYNTETENWDYDSVLGMDCVTNGSIFVSGFDEDSEGNLFFGQYSAGVGFCDTCAVAFKSIDGGESWTKHYDADEDEKYSTHVHIYKIDPYTGYHYMALGDGGAANNAACDPPYNVEKRYMLRSKDGGTTWETIWSEAWGAQSITMAFNEEYRFIGSDIDGNNFLYRTSNDTNFSSSLTLTETQQGYIWAMAANDDTVYCSTVVVSGGSKEVCLYMSLDSGENWCKAYTFLESDATDMWDGCTWIIGPDDDGYFYCFVGDDADGEDPASYKNYRFKAVTLKSYTIHPTDSEADYTTITNAIAGNASRGDTLKLLDGTHAANADTLNYAMTIKSYSNNASACIIENASGTEHGFVIDELCRFSNVTFTTDSAFSSGKSMFSLADGADLRLNKVVFNNCDSSDHPSGIYATVGGDVWINYSEIRNCDNTGTGEYGWAFFQDACLRADSLLVADNTGDYAIIGHYGATLQESLYLYNSLFEDNSSEDSGGAIHINAFDGDGQNTIIKHCTFINNECADASDGQICYTGTNHASRSHEMACNIIANAAETNAMSNWTVDMSFGSGVFGNASDTLYATVNVFQITNDAEFATEHPAWGSYVPTNETVYEDLVPLPGSYFDCFGDYIGYIQPVAASANNKGPVKAAPEAIRIWKYFYYH